MKTRAGHSAPAAPFAGAARFLGAVFVLLTGLLAAPRADAQELLQRIVDRGYVADWTIGGPFLTTAEGGIEDAIERRDPPLAAESPLAEAGSSVAEQPFPGTQLPLPGGGEITWYAYRAQGTGVNLGGLFEDGGEGVAYASFSCRTPGAATVYFDLQSPLGARLWVNGAVQSDVRAGAPSSLGVDRQLVRLPSGISHVVIAVPLTGLESLARLWGLPEDTMRARGFDNRPLLSGETPYGLALRVLAVRALGTTAYVPRLDSRGYFADTPGGPVQTAALTLFNPASADSLPIRITLQRPGSGSDPIERIVPPIAPKRQHEALLEVPLEGASPGQNITMAINLRTTREQVDFTAPLAIGNPPPRGTVFISTSGLFDDAPPAGERKRFEEGLAELDRQAKLAETDEAYGFTLGPMPLWRAYLATRPQARELFSEWVQQGRCAPFAYAEAVDARLAPPEVLLRSLAMAQRAAEGYLGQRNRTAVQWNSAGWSPQFAQMAAHAGLEGSATNLDAAGLSALGRIEALNGQTLPVRRFDALHGAPNLSLLRQSAQLQRLELSQKGIPFDLLFHLPPGAAPPSYLLGVSRPLRMEIPSLELTGNGPTHFFDELRRLSAGGAMELPLTGRWLNARRPGEIAATPELKRAYALAAKRVVLAEQYAALASLGQLDLPLDALDAAWGQLLWAAGPGRLNLPESPQVYLDTLAALREAADYASQTLDRSLDGLTALVDTAQATPIEPPGIEPFVVFNPSPWSRTGFCRAALPADLADSVTLRDDNGRDLPFAAASLPSDTGVSIPAIEFQAEDIPPMGHRTYLLVPGGALPQPTTPPTPVLETNLYRIQFDPRQGGCIISLLHKPSGTEYAARVLNDLIAFETDADLTHGGREIHSTGRFARTSESPAQVEVEKTPLRQTATVTADFAGGQVIRRVTVYEGQARIDCEIELSPHTASGALAGVYFALHRVGAGPVYGERYGAIGGRCGPAGQAFASEPGKPWTAPGLHTAWQWAATAPGPGISLGVDGLAPLAPAQIVHGKNKVLAEAAVHLLTAWLERGYPCQIWPEEVEAIAPPQTTSTSLPTMAADYEASAAMRIVLGSGSETELTQRLVATLDRETAHEFSRNLGAGTRAFLLDAKGEDSASSVPTLLIAGTTPDATLDEVRAVAAELRSRGEIAIPAGAHWSDERWPVSRPGMAVLFPGAALFRCTEDGGMLMVLGHPGGRHKGGPLDLPDEPAGVYRYALYPFLGGWDEAELPHQAAAYNYPLMARNALVQQGEIAPRLAMAEIPPGFALTALKPLGYPAAAGPSPASPGFALRGYECAGRNWQATVQLPIPLLRGASSDALEAGGTALALQGNTAELAANPWEIRTWTFTPAQPLSPSAPPVPPLDTPSNAQPVWHTRYWEHRQGAMPRGALPLSVLLEGDLGGLSPEAKAVVINNRSDIAIDGSVRLYAAAGWAVTPEHFSFRLEPGEAVERRLTVLGNGAPGGLIAESEYGGAVYRDVIESEPGRLRMEAFEEGTTYRARIHNESPLPVRGLIEVIAPPEYWPEFTGGPGIAPRAIALDIAPGGVQEAVFLNRGPADPPWVAAKASANGHVAYGRMQPVWPALSIEEGLEPQGPPEPEGRSPQTQPPEPAPLPGSQPPLGRTPRTPRTSPPPAGLAPLN